MPRINLDLLTKEEAIETRGTLTKDALDIIRRAINYHTKIVVSLRAITNKIKRLDNMLKQYILIYKYKYN